MFILYTYMYTFCDFLVNIPCLLLYFVGEEWFAEFKDCSHRKGQGYQVDILEQEEVYQVDT